ncbi:MAG: DUF167 domain-containing protein [Dehalococcoidia bacterium]|nr:DUF167 domain-containing protein [Dehalococcoidia bacterium]
MLIVNVRVQPRAFHNEIIRQEGDIWWIRLAAPPVEGKANAALVTFLAEVLDLPRGQLTITRGLSGRQKAMAIEGMVGEEVQRRLREAVAKRP